MRITQYPPASAETLVCGVAPASATAYAVESCPNIPASPTGTDALSMGDNSLAAQVDSIAVGVAATVNIAEAGQQASIAIGAGASGGGNANATISIGDAATCEANFGIAIGAAAGSEADNAIAIGGQSKAQQSNAIAIGGSSVADEGPIADAARAIAIGLTANISGADAIAIGTFANSTAVGGIAIGYGGTDAGDAAQALGVHSIALGTDAIASGLNSVAIGEDARSPQIGQYSYANSAAVARQGKNQFSRFVCYGKTTNATPTKINPDGGTTNRMILPTKTTWRFRILCSAHAETTLGNQDAHTTEFIGAIKRDSATTTALIGSVTEGTILEDAGAAAWSFAVAADDALEALQITVTGEASHTIYWTAVVDICQTTSE